MTTTFALPTDTTIAYARRFTADPQRLWHAYNEPALVARWMGYGELVTCEMDIRPGGAFRWVWKLPDSFLEIHGEVLEADPPRRLVTTEYLTDSDFPPTRNTVELVPDGDGTILRGTIECASVEIRDGYYSTGMAEGLEDSFAKLEKVAAETRTDPA